MEKKNEFNLIVYNLIKTLYPINRYNVNKRFKKGVRHKGNVHILKGEEGLKLYRLLYDELTMMVGPLNETNDIALLEHLKLLRFVKPQ